jgi:hypothetical protein
VIIPLWFGHLTDNELLFSIWSARHPRALFLNLVIGEQGSGSLASGEPASFLRVLVLAQFSPQPGPLPEFPWSTTCTEEREEDTR